MRKNEQLTLALIAQSLREHDLASLHMNASKHACLRFESGYCEKSTINPKVLKAPAARDPELKLPSATSSLDIALSIQMPAQTSPPPTKADTAATMYFLITVVLRSTQSIQGTLSLATCSPSRRA